MDEYMYQAASARPKAKEQTNETVKAQREAITNRVF